MERLYLACLALGLTAPSLADPAEAAPEQALRHVLVEMCMPFILEGRPLEDSAEAAGVEPVSDPRSDGQAYQVPATSVTVFEWEGACQIEVGYGEADVLDLTFRTVAMERWPDFHEVYENNIGRGRATLACARLETSSLVTATMTYLEDEGSVFGAILYPLDDPEAC